MQEIERKFLVRGDFKDGAEPGRQIVQGYLNSDPLRTVRVRIYGEQGYLTIKGKSSDDGTSRFEWEQRITVADARALLALCEPGVIDKIRYRIPLAEVVFEVDVFAGDNRGLVLAEVELSSPDQPYPVPPWLGEEVTGDPRYYNSYLSQHPYCTWTS